MRITGRRGLGTIQAQLLSKISAEKRDEVFTVEEARKILKINSPRLRTLLHELAAHKWIERIEKGKYLLLPIETGPSAAYGTNSLIVSRKLVAPYYVGFATALNYHGITEQVSKITFIATTKKKKTMQFQADEYKFVTLAEKRFFGFKEEWIGDLKFNISDKEKTVVDCLFLPNYCGGLTEIVKGFKEDLDYKKIFNYALRMEDQSVLKRLGYLLDVLKIDSYIAKQILKKTGGGFALLDPAGKKIGSVNKKWRVIENISLNELKAEL